jgi:DNA-binding transcriptional MerR regulator
MAALYSPTRVCELAGITYRQLNYWTSNLKIVHPVPVEGRRDGGSGNHRVYDETEASIAATLGRFRDLPEMSRLLRSVLEDGETVSIGAIRISRGDR